MNNEYCRYKDIVPFDANRVPVQPYKVDGDREVLYQIQIYKCVHKYTNIQKYKYKYKVGGDREVLHQIRSSHLHFYKLIYQPHLRRFLLIYHLTLYYMIVVNFDDWPFSAQWLHQRLVHPGPTYGLSQEIYSCPGEKYMAIQNADKSALKIQHSQF